MGGRLEGWGGAGLPSPLVGLVEAAGQVLDGVLDQAIALLVAEGFAHDATGGGNGNIGGGVADLGQGLGFGLGDALHGLLFAALDGGVQVGFGLGAQALGLFLGVADDVLGLFQGVTLAALVVGQHGLGVFAQAPGVVDAGLDLGGAGIQDAEHLAPGLEEDKADNNHERDGNPEGRIGKSGGMGAVGGLVPGLGGESGGDHRPCSLRTVATAPSTRLASTLRPARRDTMPWATLLATSRTLASALSRALAMRDSPSLIWLARRALTSVVRAVASWVAASVTVRMASWALARASARAVS
ncbi:unnamed protein product [Pararhodospirillum photometricum DSM 122]|uniref:Uncharacterized protein n=1 Tax=Pararhodospirillum photometricum DSM 122 TaxID=1150469 RepID=H6SMB2_PARPM|nr:unnamed protein product [Pararhodospirillum photometricum DSM 122]